jgi:monoamine oxidase
MGLAVRPEVAALLKALMPQQAVVTALAYADPWWRRIGIEGGASTTDLPARHLRHHGAEAWRSVPGTGLLVSYSDGESADSWWTLTKDKALGWTVADDDVAVELHRQVRKIFEPKMKTLPSPVGALTQHWNESGAGAAFHLWAAASRPEISMNSSFCPLEGHKLHICGEAWSMRQGWIEGALETADLVINLHVGAG